MQTVLTWFFFVNALTSQSTVSESTLVALLGARKDKILQLRAELDQDVDDSVLNSRLVAYASDQVGVTTSMFQHFPNRLIKTDFFLDHFAGSFLGRKGRSDLLSEDQISAHWWAVVPSRRHPGACHSGGQEAGTGPIHGMYSTLNNAQKSRTSVFMRKMWGSNLSNHNLRCADVKVFTLLASDFNKLYISFNWCTCVF